MGLQKDSKWIDRKRTNKRFKGSGHFNLFFSEMSSLDIALTFVRGPGRLSTFVPFLLFSDMPEITTALPEIETDLLEIELLSENESRYAAGRSIPPPVCLSVLNLFLLLLLDAKHPNIHQQQNSLHYKFNFRPAANRDRPTSSRDRPARN